MLRDRIQINRSMWGNLSRDSRATVCRPDLLCLLFGEEVAAAFPCGASSRWLVKWQIDCAGRLKEKLREWSEREEIDEGFLCPAQLDGPGTYLV
jgi:hypothetical protein